jgi:hypothetical protein
MVWYVLLQPLRPDLDGQDPFQISGLLCQTRKTPTLVRTKKRHFFHDGKVMVLLRHLMLPKHQNMKHKTSLLNTFEILGEKLVFQTTRRRDDETTRRREKVFLLYVKLHDYVKHRSLCCGLREKDKHYLED